LQLIKYSEQPTALKFKVHSLFVTKSTVYGTDILKCTLLLDVLVISILQRRISTTFQHCDYICAHLLIIKQNNYWFKSSLSQWCPFNCLLLSVSGLWTWERAKREREFTWVNERSHRGVHELKRN